MTLLSIKDLGLTIHNTPILSDVSFDIAPGEIVAITGESGSGKSMTAFSVMQLLPEGAEATGQIHFGGADLLTLDEPALCGLRGGSIGMVFQEPMTALNPVHTIGQQIAEVIHVHEKIPAAEVWTRTRDLLTRVGLPPDRFPLSRYPHELSGGQRQRVVIAMAIACRPTLLIADEPTTALDVTTQSQILALLQKLAQEGGMGLMIITHDLAVVAGMADRIVVMQHGRIVEQNTTQVLLRDMQHPYTRQLFAASSHRVTLPPPRSSTPLLEVNNVVRDYVLPRTSLWSAPQRFRALDNVSFNICSGERVGLVGESGCGKSTLTRAILGLDKIQSGYIALGDKPVAGRDPSVRRNMQVVFQDPFGSFNPRHRIERIITEPFYLLEDPPVGAARRDVVAETLEAVGLSPEDAERYPHQFSGGQRQRIAIARALIIKPQLVIFDEAVSALDVSVRAQILDLIAALSDAYGLTYLFISHDLTVVRNVTDRVMVMKAGQIVEQGDTEAVFSDPQHLYTQSLLKAAPVLPNWVGA